MTSWLQKQTWKTIRSANKISGPEPSSEACLPGPQSSQTVHAQSPWPAAFGVTSIIYLEVHGQHSYLKEQKSSSQSRVNTNIFWLTKFTQEKLNRSNIRHVLFWPKYDKVLSDYSVLDKCKNNLHFLRIWVRCVNFNNSYQFKLWLCLQKTRCIYK